MDRITILRASAGLPMAKTYKVDGTVESYARAKHFTVMRSSEVGGIRDLSGLLTKLERMPLCCIIRGEPVVGLERTGVRRLIENFDDKPLHSVLVEVDNYVPLLSDPVREPVEAALEYIETCLPPEFHGVAFHWQLSNSAGMPGKEKLLKVHLWFWLTTPRTSAVLRAWGKSIAIQADLSVWQPVQVHYTSAPQFEPGVADPVPVRSGLYLGENP